MSFPPGIIAIASMAAGLAISALWHARRNRRARYIIARHRLESATENLRTHSEALDRFLFRPGVPRALQEFLLTASDLFETKRFAVFMAKRLKAELPPGEDDAADIWEDLQSLYTQDAEAYDLFLQALFAGISSCLLRWPETAPALSATFAPTQDYIRRELAATARAIREHQTVGWPGLMPV
jgi:hypothetical protein